MLEGPVKQFEVLQQQSLGQTPAQPLPVSIRVLLVERVEIQPEWRKTALLGEQREMCCICSVFGSAVRKPL